METFASHSHFQRLLRGQPFEASRGAGARALRSAGPGLHSGAEWCATFGTTGQGQRQRVGSSFFKQKLQDTASKNHQPKMRESKLFQTGIISASTWMICIKMRVYVAMN